MGRIPLDVETFQNTCGFQYCCQCESYASYVETSDHVLVQCQFAKTVTQWIFKWCNTQMASFQTVQEVLEYALNRGNRQTNRKRLVGICYDVFQGIWKARNDRLFKKQQSTGNEGGGYHKSNHVLMVQTYE